MPRSRQLLANAIGGPDDALDSDLVPAGGEGERIRSSVRMAGRSFAKCAIERGVLEIAHNPWRTERTTRYQLRCGETAVELTFGLDDQTGKLASFSAHLPRASDALCWR